MLKRPVEYPSGYSIAIAPLEYGNIVQFYENRPRTVGMFADLFSACIAPCTAEQVAGMHPSIPPALEYGILLASDLLQRSDQESGRLDKADDDYSDVVRDDSMFAQHNDGGRRKDVDEDLADFLFQYVGEYHTNPTDVYSLTMGEIQAIYQGHEQAEERREGNNSGSNDGRFSDKISDARNLPDGH